jgi:anti-anti-sigma factor
MLDGRRRPATSRLELAGSDGKNLSELVIRTTRQHGLCVFELYGELDIAGATTLEQQLRFAANGNDQIIIDLSALQFIDSTGLHVLLRARERCQERGAELSLIRGPRPVHRVFELTNTEHVFSFED